MSLQDCHEEFWQLISFLQSLRNIDVPREAFSLVSKAETEIIAALRERDPKSITNIIRQLSSSRGVALSESDVNALLKRKERASTQFANALQTKCDDESWWQDFFESNKWIFGYGLITKSSERNNRSLTMGVQLLMAKGEAGVTI